MLHGTDPREVAAQRVGQRTEPDRTTGGFIRFEIGAADVDDAGCLELRPRTARRAHPPARPGQTVIRERPVVVAPLRGVRFARCGGEGA